MKKRNIILIVAVFIFSLISLRILWVELFSNQKQLPIEKGQLDLRYWNDVDEKVVLLDGEWEFYPNRLLMEDGLVSEENLSYIQVPGKWNDLLGFPFGYASYRLRIYVDSKIDRNYRMYVPSVRSSSEVYVNGRLLAKSGQVGKNKNEYVAKNLPYSTTFTADANGVIDIVIQAANFEDIRDSGIVRSIKFGSEEAIAKETKWSFSMQLLTTVMFLIHAIYALILYFLGNRDQRLLYFFLLMFCSSLANSLSSDEKLFHQFFNIGYEWDFRLATATVLIGSYALLESTEHRQLPYWRKISPIFLIANLFTAFIIIFLSPTQIMLIFPIIYLFVLISGAISGTVLLNKFRKDVKQYLLLILSSLAFIHHLVWTFIWRENGVSVVHYPFDLLLTIGFLVSIWFKHYFEIHRNTKDLATTLQRMNRQKDQFLANTSHEFKNPLHGILNMTQSVLNRDRDLLHERSIKELETILSVGNRMNYLLNDLLDLMSLQEGKPRLQKKVISIQPIANGVIDMLQLMVDVKHVKIISQIPKDFSPVLADENRMIQIFFNLLHNAVKYTNEGEIIIRAKEKNNRAYITVSDTGIGIEDELLKRIFLPYEQVNRNQTMAEGGFGLGLNITKQLVELHGGKLEVQSKIGKGSDFTFSVELAKGKEKEQKPLPAIDSISHTKPLAQGEKTRENESLRVRSSNLKVDSNRPVILVVEDDPVNLQVLEAILPQKEYDVTMVTSGKEALTILDERDWDLVISDVMMPNMSGYELTQIIRKRFTLTELPILLLTARSQPKNIQSGFLAGANDYVTKPVEPLELRARIETLTLVKRNVRQQLQLESSWLQAQIQPHFIFNTLNSVIALSEIDLEKMQDLLGNFSDFLRHKFQFKNMDVLIPIEEELNMVRSYLYIEQVRFGDRLKVQWVIDEQCNNLKVPFLTIQPLVENAIRHGLMKRIKGGNLIIRIVGDKNMAKISVEDDGIGMDEDKILQILVENRLDMKSGVGLINTDRRLKQHFGSGLHIQSKVGHGTTISFIIHQICSKTNE